MDPLHNYYIQQKPFEPQTSQVGKVHKPVSLQSGKQKEAPEVSFDTLLTETVEKQETLKFSAHAQERARSRNITFDERQLNRLSQGVEKAAAKGAREALVMVDRYAAIVSVDNKTVITVADTGTLRDNVFTNIDSAVII